MEPNLGRRERALRSLLGLCFLAIAAAKYDLGFGSMAVGALAGLAGLGLLVSGLTGYCGVYAALRPADGGTESGGGGGGGPSS